MRYAMAIDLKRCIGCHTCSVACKMANNLPNNIWYNRVLTEGGKHMDTPSGVYPNNQMRYVPVNCQHCEDPACVKVCPSGATYKREDGIVTIDKDVCIGCRACMTACPYGVRSFIKKKPEYYVDHPVGDSDAPHYETGVVEKCTFCANRLAKGEKPACMVLCPGRARYFGDLDDPNGEINKAIKDRKYVKLLENKGTNPSAFYLI